MSYERRARGKLVSHAIRTLQCRYAGLALIGSWATNEPHIPERRSFMPCSSFSDIDFVYAGESIQSVRLGAREVLNEICATTGLSIRGISVRKAADISSMPHSFSYNGRWPNVQPHTALDFLIFWTAISATEVFNLQQSESNSSSQIRLYGSAKFFFTFARNVALLQGWGLRSYRDIADWAREEIGIRNAEVALEIKVGEVNHTDISPVVSLLSHGLSAIAAWANLPLSNELTEMIEDVLSFLQNGANLCPQKYLNLARTFVYDPALENVIEHQNAKCR